MTPAESTPAPASGASGAVPPSGAPGPSGAGRRPSARQPGTATQTPRRVERGDARHERGPGRNARGATGPSSPGHVAGEPLGCQGERSTAPTPDGRGDAREDIGGDAREDIDGDAGPGAGGDAERGAGGDVGSDAGGDAGRGTGGDPVRAEDAAAPTQDGAQIGGATRMHTSDGRSGGDPSQTEGSWRWTSAGAGLMTGAGIGPSADAQQAFGGLAPEAPAAADAVARLLGEPTLRRLDVAANTGIPPEVTRRFWHALGFAASPTEEDTLYTHADQEAIQRTIAILASGKVDESLALALTRAIARSLDRLASWQSSLIMESILRAQTSEALHEKVREPGIADLPSDLAATLALDAEVDEQLWNRRLSPDASREAGQVLLSLVDEIEPLIIYAWRRHLAATVGRLMTQEESNENDGLQLAVGFADMVGFTTLVRRLSERQLARLVQHFEELAADIIAARGGRIVKMLGDEVVYAADTPEAAGDIALDLLDIVADDPSMPQLRVGLAYGPVLSHLGDIFGTTVNRASRVTNVARPHSVVIDDAMAQALGDAPGFTKSRLPPRALRGLGMTVVWTLGREQRASGRDD